MKDRFSGFLMLAILAGLAVASWWAADYVQRSVSFDEVIASSHSPDAWSGKFTLVESDETGRVRSRMMADSMEHFPDTNTWEVTYPKFISQVPNQPVMEAVADKAIMFSDSSEKIIQLIGNAKLIRHAYQKNTKMDVQSQELWVYPEKQVVQTDKPVVVNQGSSRLKGMGMTYNNRTQALNMYRGTNLKVSDKDISPKP